ncbi:cupin domain-containing protein [Collimonas sp.]|uniref:cupin domain-containing protein n=1 Tax=Collimonas sp. TaxID=1963772 RepID=UPI002D1B1AA4|nr:cupin domain-containing protein [Collimonas sp.]HWX00728.1 cupin domain-containing protein [Collimonas sp.]
MALRRIVTAHNKDGRALVVSDVQIPAHPVPGRADWSVYDVWAAENPHFPDAGERPKVNWFFPPIGGLRYLHTLMEPQTRAEYATSAPIATTAEKDGHHRSATIDTVYVVKGSCICELDDGATVQLNAGDTLIQCGAIHAWSNPFNEQCHVLAVMIGAQHDLVGSPAAG